MANRPTPRTSRTASLCSLSKMHLSSNALPWLRSSSKRAPTLTAGARGCWGLRKKLGRNVARHLILEATRVENGDAAEVVADTDERLLVRLPGGAFDRLFYRGWTATADGTPAVIDRHRGFVLAVLVSSGAHEVVLWYRPGCLAHAAAVTRFAAAGHRRRGYRGAVALSGPASLVKP